MRILNLYLTRKLLAATLGALAILTFVMMAGNLFKIADLLARGVPAAVLGEILLTVIPVALRYAIPFAVPCAVILVFSRLAADNEITAMRATGIGLWPIISPALLLGLVLSGVCYYLQSNLGPACRWRFEDITRTESVRNPLAAIEAGRFVELPGMIIYASGQDGPTKLHDLHVYGLDEDGYPVQDITARSGEVAVFEDKELVELRLHDALIVAADPKAPQDATRLQRVAGTTLTFPLNYGAEMNRRNVNRKIRYQSNADLMSLIAVYSDSGLDATTLRVELHQRLSMALSPLAFILIGIPLGIRAKRNETAVSIVLAIILAAIFYSFMVVSNELRRFNHIEFIVWAPNILYQIIGLVALWRLARH